MSIGRTRRSSQNGASVCMAPARRRMRTAVIFMPGLPERASLLSWAPVTAPSHSTERSDATVSRTLRMDEIAASLRFQQDGQAHREQVASVEEFGESHGGTWKFSGIPLCQGLLCQGAAGRTTCPRSTRLYAPSRRGLGRSWRHCCLNPWNHGAEPLERSGGASDSAGACHTTGTKRSVLRGECFGCPQLRLVDDPLMAILAVLHPVIQIASFDRKQALHRVATTGDMPLQAVRHQMDRLTDLELMLRHGGPRGRPGGLQDRRRHSLNGAGSSVQTAFRFSADILPCWPR